MFFRQILGIILAAVILISSSRGIVIWLEYKVNYNYIVKNLCVERDKPKNTCQGKCHLKENLNKNDNDKENSKDRIPYLRIKFDESSVALFELRQIINFRNQSEYGTDLKNEDKINTDKNEPLSPPPEMFLLN